MTEVKYTPSTETMPRSLFWPGFALGFLLLTMLSCGAMFMLSGLRSLSLADLQPGAPAWTPAPVTPAPETDAPAAQPPQSADALFAPGTTARNIATSRVNIRRSPGYLGKDENDVIAQMQPGDAVQILFGPENVDNLAWWRVLYTPTAGPAVEGWVAEATASGVTILGPP